ncbi:hypothetical protein V8C37DRAFT_388091 [Trichoderma ceciliae]
MLSQPHMGFIFFFFFFSPFINPPPPKKKFTLQTHLLPFYSVSYLPVLINGRETPKAPIMRANTWHPRYTLLLTLNTVQCYQSPMPTQGE